MGLENGINDLYKNNLSKDNINETPEDTKEEEYKMESFINTKALLEIAKKEPEIAELMMNRAFEIGPDRYRSNYGWLDKIQREIQNVYYDRGNYKAVERIILATKDPHSMLGRIDKYEAVVGTWPHERPKISYNEINTNAPIEDSKSFRNALKQRRFRDCETWLNDLKLRGYKGLPVEQVQKIIADRESELNKAKKETQ